MLSRTLARLSDVPAAVRGTGRTEAGEARPDRSLWELVKDLLLTRDRRQQIRLAQAGLANLLMLGCVGMANMLSANGIADARWIPAWTIFSIGGMATIFALIRSGWVLGWRDPSLTLAQMYYAVSCAVVAYCITGSARAVVIPILAVVLMFGMFGMTRRQVLAVAFYTVGTFAMASLYWCQVATPGLEPSAELARFMMVLIVMAGVIVLTSRLQEMRERLRQQRSALSAALLRIGELASRDELTGCLNRRAMLECMTNQLAHFARSGHPFCVVLLDLDNFKCINDSFGHAAGDSVLQGFADIVRSLLRGTELLGRWGGEEFLLLLPGTEAGQAQPCVQRVLDKVAAARFAGLTRDMAVTCSAGLAQCGAGESIATLVERSDRALYRAKAAGRNRLVALAFA